MSVCGIKEEIGGTVIMTPSVKDECGHQRARVFFRIREVLDKRGYTQKSLGEALGITGEAVGKTLRGHNHSARVLGKLREIGVPEKLLFDPRRAIESAEIVSKN